MLAGRGHYVHISATLPLFPGLPGYACFDHLDVEELPAAVPEIPQPGRV